MPDNGFIWLIALTLWSAIVWLIARALPQRYLAWPGLWLGLIAASLAPAIVAPLLPERVSNIVPALPVTAQMLLPAQPVAPEAGGLDIPWLIALPAAAYLLVALFLIARIFITYTRLWRLAAKVEQGSILTSSLIETPVATSFPFRAILLPEKLEGAARDLIIRHETRHLQRGDPEMTLLFEILRALMWINLPFSALVRRWRLAAELAVDTHILTGSSEQQRRDYADLLINELSRIRGQAVPCPAAALTLSEERSAKMRVSNILSPAPGMRKPAMAATAAATLCLSAAGSVFAAGLNETVPVITDTNAVPVTRTAPVFPDECTAAVGEKDNGQIEILLQFDVDRGGNVIEPTIIRSNDSCFNASVLSAISTWKFEQVFVDGVAARRENVRTVFRFQVEPSTQSEEN